MCSWPGCSARQRGSWGWDGGGGRWLVTGLGKRRKRGKRERERKKGKSRARRRGAAGGGSDDARVVPGVELRVGLRGGGGRRLPLAHAAALAMVHQRRAAVGAVARGRRAVRREDRRLPPHAEGRRAGARRLGPLQKRQTGERRKRRQRRAAEGGGAERFRLCLPFWFRRRAVWWRRYTRACELSAQRCEVTEAAAAVRKKGEETQAE